MKILALQPRIGSGGQQNAMMGLCHRLQPLSATRYGSAVNSATYNPLFLSSKVKYVRIPLSHLRSSYSTSVTKRGRRIIEKLHKEQRIQTPCCTCTTLPSRLPLLVESNWGIPAAVCFFGFYLHVINKASGLKGR